MERSDERMGVKMKREDKMEKSDEKMESVTPPGEMRTGWYRDVQASMNGDSPMYGKSEGSIPQPSAMLRGNMVGAEPVVVMPGYPSAPGNPQAPSAFEMLIEQQKLNQHLQRELSKVRYEVEKLREALHEYECERQQKEAPRAQTRYWTPEEHERFIDAVKKFGAKDVRSVASYVGTRNATQVRTHAQKYFLKMQREGKGNPIQKNRRRCMSEGDLTKVERRQSKESRGDDGEASESTLSRTNPSPLSKQPSGIDLLSVAAEAVKNEEESTR
uniref:HTH myb-type domain-containing protein n=1 Tax=Rhodosorus marinus TaxID=101924 RepID=A0A7S3EJP2_9RHOD|mmetsp:Transcript_41521/g.163393  ORF Transcript_41521/g.163393 Transcript_41521/m.163393 type:complete len:272 (+) Transcript_41521:353-1168(+)